MRRGHMMLLQRVHRNLANHKSQKHPNLVYSASFPSQKKPGVCVVCLKSYRMQLDSHGRQIHSHVSPWAIHNTFLNAHGVCFICQYCPMASLRKHQWTTIHLSLHQITKWPLSLLLKRSLSDGITCLITLLPYSE
jgi:hypothetical protein